jgi:hypothetical protein
MARGPDADRRPVAGAPTEGLNHSTEPATEDTGNDIPAGTLSKNERATWRRGTPDEREVLAALARRRVAASNAEAFPGRAPAVALLCGNPNCGSRRIVLGWPQRFAVPAATLPDGAVWQCRPCSRSTPTGTETSTRRSRPAERVEGKTQCWQCDTWFPTVRADARYCSSACRMAASRARNRSTPTLERRRRRHVL